MESRLYDCRVFTPKFEEEPLPFLLLNQQLSRSFRNLGSTPFWNGLVKPCTAKEQKIDQLPGVWCVGAGGAQDVSSDWT